MTGHGPAPCPSWPTHELQPSCKMAPHRGPGRGCDEEDHHGSSGHCGSPAAGHGAEGRDRKSTRLNSSHLVISYAVFCLKKKKTRDNRTWAARLLAAQSISSAPADTST